MNRANVDRKYGRWLFYDDKWIYWKSGQMEEGKSPLYKWEFSVEELGGSDSTNPSKIVGQGEGILEIIVPEFPTSRLVTKNTVLSHLGSIYDSLGPTLVAKIGKDNFLAYL